MVRELGARGRNVSCPDLRPALDAPEQERGRAFIAEAVRAAVGDQLIVIGHSGAGVFMPSIAEALADRAATTVFVDAAVPPASGQHELSAPFAEFIDTQTTGGLLAPWLDWWPEAVDRMLPDAALRESVAADMPQVPRSFYDEVVAMPELWSNRSNCYLQLSPAYRADREDAEAFGWPTATLDGTHLSIATDPLAVLAAIDLLLD